MNTSKVSRVMMVMDRTISNLTFIEKHSTDDGPFEVVQLLNSFLGALAHPWEGLKEGLQKIELSDAVTQGWPVVKKQLPTDSEPKHLSDLIRLMRNGMAHGGIKFLPPGDGRIEKIEIVNVDPRCGHRTWGTVLSVDDVRAFLKAFVALANSLSQAPC